MLDDNVVAKQGTQVTRTTASARSRRDCLRLAASAAAFGPFFLFPGRALVSQKTLKVAKWGHFVHEFDQLIVNVVAADWGRKNDTKVTVDIVPVEGIRDRAFAEVKASKGHDVFIFPWPPAEYHQHTIDHSDVYQAVAPRYGAIQQLAFRSTFNFKTKTHFAFADFWVPSPLHFFQDYWGQIGMPLGPVHYGSLLGGGKMLRDQLGIPCGLAFSPTLEGNVTLHTILYAFRAWILDVNGNVLFNKNAFAVTRGQGRGAGAAKVSRNHQAHRFVAPGGEKNPKNNQKKKAPTAIARTERHGNNRNAPCHQLFRDLELCAEPGRSEKVRGRPRRQFQGRL